MAVVTVHVVSRVLGGTLADRFERHSIELRDGPPRVLAALEPWHGYRPESLRDRRPWNRRVIWRDPAYVEPPEVY